MCSSDLHFIFGCQLDDGWVAEFPATCATLGLSLEDQTLSVGVFSKDPWLVEPGSADEVTFAVQQDSDQ